MRRIETETVEEYKLVKEEKVIHNSILCNKCGKESVRLEDSFVENEYQNIELSFGYGSSFDGESWSLDLCEDCLIELVKTFKHVPEGFMYDGYTFISNEEEKQKVFDNWKLTGKWDELKFKTYEEIVSYANGYISIEYLNEAIKEYYPGKELITVNEIGKNYLKNLLKKYSRNK